MLSLALWIQSTDLFTAIRLSAYVYPIIMTCHLAGIGLFGGMILIVDLRLLGVAMCSRPVADVMQQLRGLKHLGFAIVAVCGALMLGSKAEEYYYNAFFRTKLVLLGLVGVHALVFRGSVYGNPATLDQAPRMPARARLAATLSLLLWTGLVITGRGIGYVQVPAGIHAGSVRALFGLS